MSVTITSAYHNIVKLSASVGMLIDRCVAQPQHIGTVFLVDTNTVATCAHLVVLYADFLQGLRVQFPATDETFIVTDVSFHPRFDCANALEMAQRSLSASVPALALQDYNLALLHIEPDNGQLDQSAATTFNKRIALAPLPRIKGLAGNVEDIGLALVAQTVANARKDGVLYITDERNRPLARMFFREGRVLYAKLNKLSNEFAVYQMFQTDIKGQFYFKQQETPDWDVSTPIERPLEGMLLEAHRRMDEVPNLLTKLGGPTSSFSRTSELLRKDGIPSELIPYAERIWAHLDGGVSIDHLYEIVSLDNCTTYSAILAMRDSGQIEAVPLEVFKDAKSSSMPLAPYEPLSPWDEIVSLTAHAAGGRAQMRRGSLVGLLRPNDPYHLLHSLNLPYRCAGSPLLKKGKVVGIHCGMLPLDPGLHALPHHLHQFLWIDAVQACMNTKQKKSLPNKKSVGMVSSQQAPAGKKICPKCQALMVKQAVFCGTCGSKM